MINIALVYLMLSQTPLEKDADQVRVIHSQPELCLGVWLDLQDDKLSDEWTGSESFAILPKWKSEEAGCEGSDWLSHIAVGRELQAVIKGIEKANFALINNRLQFVDLLEAQEVCVSDARSLVLVSYMIEEWSSISLIFEGCPGLGPKVRVTAQLYNDDTDVVVEPFIAVVSGTDLE